jgi:predicted RND superfamily exporter protein
MTLFWEATLILTFILFAIFVYYVVRFIRFTQDTEAQELINQSEYYRDVSYNMTQMLIAVVKAEGGEVKFPSYVFRLIKTGDTLKHEKLPDNTERLWVEEVDSQVN